MKVLILSTFGNYGGAAVCSKRLYQALKKHDVKVHLGVMHAYDGEISEFLFRESLLGFFNRWFHFVFERLAILFKVKLLKDLYKFSSGLKGPDLLSNSMIQEADVIHLHWVNFGFFSIEEIRKLSEIKPVIWTMHDMWAFTGGCHYVLGCNRYKEHCNDCFYLKKSVLSASVQSLKIEKWSDSNFKVVATSNWLAKCASESTVFKHKTVEVLSTPIDLEIFFPLDKKAVRSKFDLPDNKYFILIGAVDFADERKGFKFLKEALEHLSKEMDNLHLLTFGKINQELLQGIECTSFGQVSDLKYLSEIYNLADVFVLPSIQDNLPNTVMEALSCGVPVASFDSGGVTDMVITGQTGYLAKNMDAVDLASGIQYVLKKGDTLKLSQQSRKRVVRYYGEDVIVQQHLQVYRELIRNFTYQ